MLEKSKIKEHLLIYLNQRVIIFKIDEYLSHIADNIIRDMDEWGLIGDKKIPQREKYFKFFLEKELDKILESFIIIFRDLNIKIYTIYKNNTLSIEYSEYFEDINKFGNNIKNILKKKTKYFKYINNNKLLFNNTLGYYKTIKVGIPNGDDLEFFNKYIK
jgi:hypothetical protein